MSAATRTLPFPRNLSPGQITYIEAVGRHGTLVAAAKALGISQSTMRNRLIHARFRAGVSTTAELVQLYRQATQGSPS